MTLRRSFYIVAALATLAEPAVAVIDPGTVITVPSAGTPAIGIPLLLLLALALAGGGLYLLRHATGGVAAKVGCVVTLIALGGLAYAGIPTITISGAECGMQAVNTFEPTTESQLLNSCPNPIAIISIQFSCNDPAPPNACRVGKVLFSGESCMLPVCA